MHKVKTVLRALALVFSLYSTQTISAQYTPFFQNYSLSEYNAGNQNWGVSNAEDGTLYVANAKGLLVFDGLNWSLEQLPNKTIIRSVKAIHDRIYTGSYQEFGYWEKDTKGAFVYQSLSSLFKEYDGINEEIWQIVSIEDAIVFRSFSSIYIYKNGKVTKRTASSTVISFDVVDDTLFISTLRHGVFSLVDDELVPFIQNKTLLNKKIVSVSKYRNGFLLTTALSGCFLFSNGSLLPLELEISEVIKKFQLNRHTILPNGNMAFGTIQNGIYLTNYGGEILFHLNKGNGLANNTILSQTVSNKNELWLGLDNGLAVVDLQNSHSFYNDVTGKLGAVYDVISYKNTIYLGSNTGLYFLDNDNELQFVEGSQGQVWELKEINGQLFCGHNNGTYVVDKGSLKLVSSFTGGWMLKKVPEQPNMYMQGTYTGIVRFKKEQGDWEAKHIGSSTDPIQYLVFEDQYTAWAAHAYKGLYRVQFDVNYDSVISMKNYAQKGLLSDYNVRVHKIKNEICFKTNFGWQQYEPLKDTIVSYDYLNSEWGRDSYIISEKDISNTVLKNNDAITFKPFDENKKSLYLAPKYFRKRLIVDFENVSSINDSIYALNLNEGFMLVNINSANYVDSLSPPVVERVIVNKELVSFRDSEIVQIPFKESFSITVSSPKSRDHYFEYAIGGSGSLVWKKMENSKLELSNVNNGEFSLLFRTTNDLNRTSAVTTLKVNILPPWYKGTTGILLFIFLLFPMMDVIYYFHKKKIYKASITLQAKYIEQQEAMLQEKTIENEKRIIQLRNQSLKNEVKLKSKQLANTAMALVKKNEAIQEIKKELVQNKINFDNTYSFKKVLKKLDDSIGHEDEWEVFEYNFNQVHEEFFNTLKSKFPKLTHKDLKICAYIKMNLTNKEIAPLMNISVRGVETHRYRLKGKLKLENHNSVTDFLRNLV